jgi:DNA polymerase III delta prime subunit
MTLGAVKSGKIAQPLRVLLYGPEGVGKTTFGANAPKPIFLGAEDGHANLDVAYFPEPHSWGDILDAIRVLGAESHGYETLVLDTLDWLEPFCWKAVCAAGRKTGIEDFGFGKGYVAALDEWRVFVSALEAVRRAKRMNVVMLAHSQVKTFKNPEGDDYDRYSLKVHEKAAGLLKEWSDAVLFTNYETHVLKDGAKAKGYGGGTRVIHTERRAAFDAKNRFGLPETMPLDWSEFANAVEASRAPDVVNVLRADLHTLMQEMQGREPQRVAALAKWLETPAANSADSLRAAINKAKTILGGEAKGSEGVQS